MEHYESELMPFASALEFLATGHPTLLIDCDEWGYQFPADLRDRFRNAPISEQQSRIVLRDMGKNLTGRMVGEIQTVSPDGTAYNTPWQLVDPWIRVEPQEAMDLIIRLQNALAAMVDEFQREASMNSSTIRKGRAVLRDAASFIEWTGRTSAHVEDY